MKMIFKYVLVNLGMCLFLFACSQEQKTSSLSLHVPFQATWFQVALDTVPAPESLPLNPKQRKIIGSPERKSFPNYEVPANRAEFLVQANYNTLTAQPEVYKLYLHKKKAKLPEVTKAKAPQNSAYNPFNFNTFDLEFGLLDDKVHLTFQDSQRNIWFASFAGLTRYNGKTNAIYTSDQGLKDPYILHMEEDKNGVLWLASDRVLETFDGKYITEVSKGQNSIFEITDLAIDKNGATWITSTDKGLYKIDLQAKKIFRYGKDQGLSDNLTCLDIDQEGNFWIGTEKEGILIWNGNEIRKVTLPTNNLQPRISSIYINLDGSVWLGSYNQIFLLKENSLIKYRDFGAAWVNTIKQDKTGTIWFSSDAGGIFYIDQDKVSNIRVQHGLPSNESYHVMEDDAGNLWFSTYGGAVKYNKMFRTWSKQEGLSSSIVRAMHQDRQRNIWLGTELGGISYVDFDQQKITNYYPRNGLQSQNIISILSDRDKQVWLGAYELGVSTLDVKNQLLTIYENSGHFITKIYEDQHGDIWYGRRIEGGVVCIPKGSNTAKIYSKAQGLVDNEVIDIKQDKDGNYIFTTFAGISILDKNKTVFTNYPKTDKQKLEIVECATEDATGALWLTTLTGGGLYRLDRKKQIFHKFTTEDGLPNNALWGSILDASGNLWINSRRGLVKMKSANILALDDSLREEIPAIFKCYLSEDGHLGHGDGRSYITIDKYNRLWLPMAKNLRIVDPTEEIELTKNQQVTLTSLALFKENVAWEEGSLEGNSKKKWLGGFRYDSLSRWYNIPQSLILDHTNKHLNFDFVFINPQKHSSTLYRYYLDGLEETWSNPTEESTANYTNLTAGKYTFKVQASSGDGKWSEATNFSFIVLPPWWLTWWAKLVYVCLLFLAVYFFTKWKVNQRLKKVKELELIRTKISADLHDDVGSILSGLSMQTQWMAINADSNLKKSLLELSEMSHQAMDSMRDTVWAIDPRKDRVENLVDRMRSFAEKNLSLKNISHNFQIEIENAKAFINPEKRQNCYLIFKEAITNICKHSDASFVQISFKKVEDTIQLIIQDNGSEKAAYASDGTGLNNMSLRARKVDGKLITVYDSGFRVWFSFAKD